MNFILRHSLMIFCLAASSGLSSQNRAVLLPEFSYSYGIPFGDLKDRFGSHLCLGVGLNYQPEKNHFNFGGKFSYYFNSDVREDVLSPFRTQFGGLLIGRDNYLAEMKLRERAYSIQIHAGGLIPVFSQAEVRRSIKWQLGVGFIEHYIRFVDDARALAQFNDEYVKGLDRLSNGWALMPFIGYEYLSRKGWLSFNAGIETVLAFTSGKRDFNYDTNQSDFGISRFDGMLNFKFGLYLPLYLNRDAEFIEY